MTDLGIGIIGAGYMARTFAECLAKYAHGGRLRAIAGGRRAPATAAEFQACDRAGVTLCLAHILRWRGSPRRGKEVIDAGRIGRVQIIDFTWRDVRSSTAEKAWTLDSVRNGRQPLATGQDGRAAVEIAEAANRSSQTGEAIALPFSPGGV